MRWRDDRKLRSALCFQRLSPNQISKLWWQDLETRGRISDLIIDFKIQTGNVKIPFPNDLLETASPYVTRASTQHPSQYQHFLSNINSHKFSFFVRTVLVWNALPPASVYADNVNAFHSSICGKTTFLIPAIFVM